MPNHKISNFTDYQKLASGTAIYPAQHVREDGIDAETHAMYTQFHTCSVMYPALGLTGEAGEVADKIKKIVRDYHGQINDDHRKSLAKELGDVLWYIAAISSELGLDMQEIAQGNIDKLYARRDKGTLKGSGDDR